MGTPVASHAATIVGATVIRSWYAEERPAATARHLVHRVWHGEPGWRRRMRLLPDGCLDLSWDGSTVTVTPATAEAITIHLEPGGVTSGVRLLPEAAVVVLGRPAPTLDGPVALDQLWPADAVTQLTERLLRSPSDVADLLVAAVADGADAVDRRPDPVVGAFVRGVRQPGATIHAVARSVGVSGRELHRRVRNDTALSPKRLQEILRFRRALDGMTTLGLAHAAAVAGYYDQAHLARQVRQLVRTTPSRLVRTMTGEIRPACGEP